MAIGVSKSLFVAVTAVKPKPLDFRRHEIDFGASVKYHTRIARGIVKLRGRLPLFPCPAAMIRCPRSV
ncbi:MAG: hypothetical protein JXQ73_33625 [Phycisphaerae bacterium]|nr:hypothetical protein [Phycisphaerae bacterium]